MRQINPNVVFRCNLTEKSNYRSGSANSLPNLLLGAAARWRCFSLEWAAMDFFRKALDSVENEMSSNAGTEPGAARPATAPATGASSGLGGNLLSNITSAASSASEQLRSTAEQLSSGAAAAATELALREELSRKEDALAGAEAEIRLLQRQLEESPGPPAAVAASARPPETVLESQEKVLELEAREAKLKALLKKLHEAKSALEQRCEAGWQELPQPAHESRHTPPLLHQPARVGAYSLRLAHAWRPCTHLSAFDARLESCATFYTTGASRRRAARPRPRRPRGRWNRSRRRAASSLHLPPRGHPQPCVSSMQRCCPACSPVSRLQPCLCPACSPACPACDAHGFTY